MKWEVEVLDTTAVDAAWYEDSVVRLRHVTTGQYLGATDSRYPDTDCTVLYCTVLYCTVLYCTVQYSTVLACTGRRCGAGGRRC